MQSARLHFLILRASILAERLVSKVCERFQSRPAHKGSCGAAKGAACIRQALCVALRVVAGLVGVDETSILYLESWIRDVSISRAILLGLTQVSNLALRCDVEASLGQGQQPASTCVRLDVNRRLTVHDSCRID